jgi:hypothetical protein
MLPSHWNFFTCERSHCARQRLLVAFVLVTFSIFIERTFLSRGCLEIAKTSFFSLGIVRCQTIIMRANNYIDFHVRFIIANCRPSRNFTNQRQPTIGHKSMLMKRIYLSSLVDQLHNELVVGVQLFSCCHFCRCLIKIHFVFTNLQADSRCGHLWRCSMGETPSNYERTSEQLNDHW